MRATKRGELMDAGDVGPEGRGIPSVAGGRGVRSRALGAVRLSPHGRAVLRACAESPLRLASFDEDPGGVGGCLPVADLVRQTPGRPAVVKASLSRTLRRLWRAGWVRLVTSSGYSLTDIHASAAAELQAAERDPDGTYARSKAFGGFFLYATPEEYLAYLRTRAAWLPRGQAMRFVQITRAGRVRLTVSHRAVNRTPRSPAAARLTPNARPGARQRDDLEPAGPMVTSDPSVAPGASPALERGTEESLVE